MMQPLTPEAILETLPKLPAFPRVVTQILAILDDDNSCLTALINHLQRDPVIAGRVLSAANASQFAHRSLGGISAAVSFIGMRRIREIVLTTSLLDFSRNLRGPQFFWEHSLAVGICTQELAREVGLDEDQALVAGLLHDIGKLWMAYLHPRENQHIQGLLAHEPHPLCELEREMFGLDHCAIGSIIARYWRLPEEIIEAITLHHQQDTPELGRLAAATHVAEAICNGLDLPPREDNQVIAVSQQAMVVLGIDWNQDMSDLLGRTEARFRQARAQLH
jgi:putative nucleotidyltransferase with HDIG domain